ncbi:hypothetical protein SAMN05216227_101021 [Pseudorhodobacter antarcticus]|jgi:hypothetical protein|uniref:Uncharacterized protein n=1 Tax=Pseudorhodobacter antarcticus TaxID=1077947 RepID=A0A1H8F5I2_9RHOB|nr:hypothetical protein [Pseudorhodobacter antarcticus]SEN26328.1 hypothetical protein SAMN05216227_101021 [Pseudorhodobacter antarcticus]
MAELPRDSIMGAVAMSPLRSGEHVLAEWPADPAAYWRSHAVMAALGGVIAGVVLVAIGNPSPWVGPVAAVLALGARGWYVASEALEARWRLTDQRLQGPGGREVPLARLRLARRFLGDVQVITHSGDKYLMKYLADGAAVVAAIDAAKAGLAK